jgi:hypothetical protein
MSSDATSSRELLILIKTIRDASVQADFQAIAAMAKSAQGAATTAAKGTAAAQAQAARDAVKATREWEKDVAASYKAACKAAERDAKATEKAQRDAAREAAKAQKAVEHIGLQATAASAKMAGSLARSAHGVEQLARGFVLLGVASEDDLQRAVQKLAALQGCIDLLKGTASILKGVTGAWRSYATAVELATAAEKARSLLTAGGAAASLTGTVVAGGAAAGGVGAGAGLLTGAFSAVAAGASVAAAALTSIPAMVAYAAASAGVIANVGGSRDFLARKINAGGWTGNGGDTGFYNAIGRDLRTGLFGGVGTAGLDIAEQGLGGVGTRSSQDAEQQLQWSNQTTKRMTEAAEVRWRMAAVAAKEYANQTADEMRQQAITDAAQRGHQYGEDVGSLRERAADTARAAELAKANANNRLGTVASFERHFEDTKAESGAGAIENAKMLQGAIEAYIADVERATQAEHARGEAGKAAYHSESEAAKESIANLRERIEGYKQLAAATRGKEEQFAAMDPFQQARLVMLRQRFDQGAQMSGSELAELKGWVGPEAGRKISGKMIGLAEAHGFAGIYGEKELRRDAVERQEAEVRRLQGKLDIKEEFMVRVDWDAQRLAASVRDAINAEQKEVVRLLRSEMMQNLQPLVRTQQWQEDQQQQNETRRHAT